MIILRDITTQEQLKKEKAMRKYTKIMYASASHELRTPANAIINSLSLLENTATEKQKKWINLCKTSSRFLMCLIDDTLDFASLSCGKFQLNYQICDIRNLIHEVFDLFDLNISTSQKVSYILELDERLKQNIVCDPKRFKQIIINLMRNA